VRAGRALRHPRRQTPVEEFEGQQDLRTKTLKGVEPARAAIEQRALHDQDVGDDEERRGPAPSPHAINEPCLSGCYPHPLNVGWFNSPE